MLGAWAKSWPTMTPEVQAQVWATLSDSQRLELEAMHSGEPRRARFTDTRPESTDKLDRVQQEVARLRAEVCRLQQITPPDRLLPPVKPDIRKDILRVLQGGASAPWILGNLAHSEGYRDYYTGPDAYDQCRADCMRELYTLRADGLILWDGDSGDRVILVKDVQNV